MSSLAGVSSTGLVLAVMVTGVVYLASLAYPATATGVHTRRKGPVLGRRISRILSYLSSNSLDDLIDTIKPAVGTFDILPDISRVGTGEDEKVINDDQIVHEDVTGAIESVGSITNTVSEGVSDSLESVSDTADTLSRVVSDRKLKDCLLQTICYLTPEEGSSEEGEGRKNQEKQDRREKEKKEKQKRKRLKKNKKKKLQDEEDPDISTDIDDEDVNTIKITSDDCEEFKCDIVKYGYAAFKVLDKMRSFKERLDSLNLEGSSDLTGDSVNTL